MTTRLSGPLVGTHFRPPAGDIVNLLPANARLIIQRQPENQYDMNACQVLLPGFCKNGPLHSIWQQFANDALDDEDALAALSDPFFLGYVANSEKTGGKRADLIAKIMDDGGFLRSEAWLTFDHKGNAVVETDCVQLLEADL